MRVVQEEIFGPVIVALPFDGSKVRLHSSHSAKIPVAAPNAGTSSSSSHSKERSSLQLQTVGTAAMVFAVG